MLLSVVIPAHNEADGITPTVTDLHAALAGAGIEHEIVVVNDHSSDRTAAVVTGLCERIPEVRMVDNHASGGFGMAVRAGLAAFRGDAVAVYMADASDSPEDLVMFVRTMEVRGVDCVFGSRFAPGGEVIDYPRLKLLLNRIANTGIRALFGLRYDDMTNAFKLYRREVIEGISPLLSHHFNLTVEMPLKAIVRGYSFAVVPNTWTNRAHGTSKFQIQEMGSRYAFIVLYCFLERWLSRGDYRRRTTPADERSAVAAREDA
jgi:dolichol-phosphate mannosyltransferase